MAKEIFKKFLKPASTHLEQYAQQLDAQGKDRQATIDIMVPSGRVSRVFKSFPRVQERVETLVAKREAAKEYLEKIGKSWRRLRIKEMG